MVFPFRSFPQPWRLSLRQSLSMQSGAGVDVEGLTAKVQVAFDASTNNELTRPALNAWEGSAVAVSSQLRQVSDKKALYSIYTSLLKTASPLTLDPLQVATFDMLSSAIVDALIRIFPKGIPVTSLIDELTETHLSFVEEFRTEIDDGGSDGYSQSARQEFLCYQFAGLVERVYTRVSKGLGAEFDNSPKTMQMRVSNWVSPVYARLQRRFVRFLAGNVEEKVEESNSQAFDRMLEKIVVAIEPPYLLPHLAGVSNPPQTAASAYPGWDLTFFIAKVLRNTLGAAPSFASVEPRVAQRLQNDLSVKMRALGRPLERIASKLIGDKRFRLKGSGAEAGTGAWGLDTKEVETVEAMLAVAHISAAAVFTVWNVRHNIVGVPEDPAAGFDGKVNKDFLSPVSLSAGRNNTLMALPRALRRGAEAAVEEVAGLYSPTEELECAALLAHAVRSTAAEEFRALITYNSDPSEWPASRDSSYSAVLASVLIEALVQTDDEFDTRVFHENLLALAALEETIGVREPRAACILAYEMSLKHAALLKIDSAASSATEFSSRRASVESALGMFGRLPETQGNKAAATATAGLRMSAFRAVVDALLADAPPGQTAAALRRVESLSSMLAEMLGIDERDAATYVGPLGRSVFDRSVGSLLVSKEITASGSGSNALEQAKVGRALREQVAALAADLSLSPQEAQERTGYLAGAVFESLVETALEEHRRLSVDRAEMAMMRAYSLCRHPLLLGGDEDGGKPMGGDAVVEVGVRMTLARLGASRLSEVVRMTEILRGKQQQQQQQQQQAVGVGGGGGISGGPQGWGAAMPGSAAVRSEPAYGDFLASLQDKLLKAYSKAQLQVQLRR